MDSSTSEGKGERRVRKENKETEERNWKGEFVWLVICRAISQQEIDTQLGQLAGEFQKKESAGEIQELERDGDQNSGG